jgi:hypothetical protein
MNVEVRILQELRTHFLEVRILQGLGLCRPWEDERPRSADASGTFELAFAITRKRVTYW